VGEKLPAATPVEEGVPVRMDVILVEATPLSVEVAALVMSLVHSLRPSPELGEAVVGVVW
jgi:hypothetical protein